MRNLISNITKKKTEVNVKEVLLRLLKERINECDAALDEMVEQVTRFKNAISIINNCEEIIKTQKSI